MHLLPFKEMPRIKPIDYPRDQGFFHDMFHVEDYYRWKDIEESVEMHNYTVRQHMETVNGL